MYLHDFTLKAIPKKKYYEDQMDDKEIEDFCTNVLYSTDINTIREYAKRYPEGVGPTKEQWKKIEGEVRKERKDLELYKTNEAYRKKIHEIVREDVIKRDREPFDKYMRDKLLKETPYGLPIEDIINGESCWLFYEGVTSYKLQKI